MMTLRTLAKAILAPVLAITLLEFAPLGGQAAAADVPIGGSPMTTESDLVKVYPGGFEIHVPSIQSGSYWYQYYYRVGTGPWMKSDILTGAYGNGQGNLLMWTGSFWTIAYPSMNGSVVVGGPVGVVRAWEWRQTFGAATGGWVDLGSVDSSIQPYTGGVSVGP